MKITDAAVIKSEESFENWMFVSITLENGMKGFGEISSAPKHSNSVAETVYKTTRTILGCDIQNVCLQPESSDSIVLRTAESGIDQALLDLKAQLAGVPLYRFLGGNKREISLYANINRALRKIRDSKIMIEHFYGAKDFGFEKVKISPFDFLNPLSEKKVVETEVREAIVRIKKAVEIFGCENVAVDCHQKFSIESADYFLSELRSRNIDLCYVEDLFDYDDEYFPELKKLNEKYGYEFAGGELCTTPESVMHLADAGCFKIYNPDIKFLGKIDSFISAAKHVFDKGRICAPHNPTSPISTAFSAAVVSAFNCDTLLEFAFGSQDLRNELLGYKEQADGKIYILSDNAGSGVSISDSFLKKYCYSYDGEGWQKI